MKDQADVVVADETPKATSRPKEATHSPNEINFAINAAKFQEHWLCLSIPKGKFMQLFVKNT